MAHTAPTSVGHLLWVSRTIQSSGYGVNKVLIFIERGPPTLSLSNPAPTLSWPTAHTNSPLLSASSWADIDARSPGALAA
jgi:hypothetical protein